MQNYKTNIKTQGICQFELTKRLYTTDFFSKIKLTNTTKLVLFALTNHYNSNNEDMFPSQRFMAQQLGISEKSVERAVKELALNNLIVYLTKKVNRYKFTSKFFDLVKMSDLIGQNVGDNIRQNVGQINKTKNINNNYFQQNFKKSVTSTQNQIVKNETQFLLEKIKKDKQNTVSPLDFSRKDAQKWLNSLRPEFHNSFFARELYKKFGFKMSDNIKNILERKQKIKTLY